VAGSLGITFTNGGVGAFPLVVGLVVAFYLGDQFGTETAKGVGYAIGMIIWSSQTLMMILLGLLSLVLLPKNYTAADAKQAD
jgi:glycosyltransferase 2 family protein